MVENKKHFHFPLDLGFSDVSLYVFTSLMVLGNIIFPWLVHTIPQGGLKFLPIYFFVLIASYKFGLKAGLMTATISPLANTFLTGMPPAQMLPIILVKGILLAIFAYMLSYGTRKLSIANLVLTVFLYQAVGILFETAFYGSFLKALSDFTIGWPGLIIQIFGGYLVLWLLGGISAKK